MFEVSGATVSQWVIHLADVSRDVTDTERVDLVRALEDLKNIAAAAQATAVVDLDTSQRAAQEQRGRPAARLGEGVASQVGLARHVRESRAGGETSETNLQGLCERCNLAKQAPGWRARPSPETAAGTERHTVITTTPTGHTYQSRAPAPLGHLDYNSRTLLGYDLIA